ncbi:cytokine-dependent hematopoietic cell linker [Kryptolebias marmoratus]|uniref:cytokine-dependent hematopoietic cell linker n=1 Tax=Kryptolebias marmoratus TaxID=37003 RepID=UPI0007F8A0CF|nr:cytokine-dependent hematopoietic cell linker [Kryptolebias marmoratus]XP_017263691.1 cytokine-dependent hematopoietic cell linker [Kryptolebias marmoratus]
MNEPEYDEVDDHEEVHSVRILPARPINDDREYADRDRPWSSSNQSLPAVSTHRVPPRFLPRDMPHIAGPAVNRDLKPNRRKIKLERRRPPLEPEDDESNRCNLPLPFVLELSRNISDLAVHEPGRKDPQLRTTKKGDSSLHLIGQQTAKSVSGQLTHQRHSLDLETHDLDNRAHQSLERVPSRRHHHEWPRTKEDLDQSDFVPVEKPNGNILTYCEEDWYVGACNRTDAEHALHLVNKDGAFLVRDCSINTNSEPLVLAVYHEKKVYNVKIRFVEATRKYALGTGQRSNDMFDSVAEIIKFHSLFPITLISGRNVAVTKYPENCVLTCPLTKRDVEHLLR